MKDEFAWLRGIILLSAGVFVLGLFVRVCRETSEQRARLEAAVAAASSPAGVRTAATRTALLPLPPCRIVPTGWIPDGMPADPE